MDPLLLASLWADTTTTTAIRAADVEPLDPALDCALEECPPATLLRLWELEREARIRFEAETARLRAELRFERAERAAAETHAAELEARGPLVLDASAPSGCSLGVLGAVCGACLVGGAGAATGVIVGARSGGGR